MNMQVLRTIFQLLIRIINVYVVEFVYNYFISFCKPAFVCSKSSQFKIGIS